MTKPTATAGLPPKLLMIGTGEYTTGFVHGAGSPSDKGAGVVALACFDLRRRGLLGELLMAGTRGTKFPAIKTHLQEVIGHRYRGLETSFRSFPGDDVESDPNSYRSALEVLGPGDVVTVFTPDDTHFGIALDSVKKGCHVLVAKPLVKTLEQHAALEEAAREQGVLVAMEVHKRWDPIYRDARDRIRGMGDFGHFSSYMSQPKSQLETFRSWAGKSSDISYYLNAHHIDFHNWSVGEFARPVRVSAFAASGVATGKGMDTEDSITLAVVWENVESGNQGTALYTASWVASKSDVHSQQRFFYQGHEGEIQIDQAHRGYSISQDGCGLQSPNPLFMKYEPDGEGEFAGQDGYGYRSIESFVHAARSINARQSVPDDWNSRLASVSTTERVTAILEAGRRSLDQDARPVGLEFDSGGRVIGFQE